MNELRKFDGPYYDNMWNSSIITSPGHMKRMLKALQDDVKDYEKDFGKITVAKAPEMISSKPK